MCRKAAKTVQSTPVCPSLAPCLAPPWASVTMRKPTQAPVGITSVPISFGASFCLSVSNLSCHSQPGQFWGGLMRYFVGCTSIWVHWIYVSSDWTGVLGKNATDVKCSWPQDVRCTDTSMPYEVVVTGLVDCRGSQCLDGTVTAFPAPCYFFRSTACPRGERVWAPPLGGGPSVTCGIV